jgi:hypothetical protein
MMSESQRYAMRTFFSEFLRSGAKLTSKLLVIDRPQLTQIGSNLTHRQIIALIIAATTNVGAQADILPGRGLGYEAQSRQIIHPIIVAEIALRCGVRNEGWLSKVHKAVDQQLRNLAARTWPNDSNKQSYYRGVAFIHKVELASFSMRNMTSEDCHTLRIDPQILARADGLAILGGTIKAPSRIALSQERNIVIHRPRPLSARTTTIRISADEAPRPIAYDDALTTPNPPIEGDDGN